ncbi:MAG: hypothetical protein WC460_06570 [Patescibacteria group bacterium]
MDIVVKRCVARTFMCSISPFSHARVAVPVAKREIVKEKIHKDAIGYYFCDELTM